MQRSGTDRFYVLFVCLFSISFTVVISTFLFLSFSLLGVGRYGKR
jgi:hypothetical protein